MEFFLFTTTPWALTKEVNRLNKKASRIGVASIICENLGKVERERLVLVSGGDGEGQVTEHRVPVSCTHFRLVTPEPSERSWVPLAKITPIEGSKPFVEALESGYDVSPWQAADPQHCDHCNVNRRRLISYVVRNPEGKVMQLGRNCFADYVGKDTLAQFEFMSVVQHNLGGDEEGFYPMGGGCGTVQVVNTRDIVAKAEALCLIDGWRNNEKDQYSGYIEKNGTHRVAAHRRGEDRHTVEAKESMNLTEKDASHPAFALADAAIARMRDTEVAEGDEFASTLKNIAEYDVIPEQKASLAAYIGQYLRNVDRKAAEAAKAATMQFVGTVGARLTFDLTCVRSIPFESDYGGGNILIFSDASGNELVWKTGSASFGEGEKVVFKATVKAHNEFRGKKQTIITRAKEVAQTTEVK